MTQFLHYTARVGLFEQLTAYWCVIVGDTIFRHFFCKMYRLATVHFVTDRQTDRRQYHANSRSYYAQQYGWLKMPTIAFI